jgi:hypothetical protein
MHKKREFQKYELVGEYVSIFQRGRRWHAHYRLDGRPIRPSLKTTSKKQARTKALAIERDLVNGVAQRPRRAPLIMDVIDAYMEHVRAKGLAKTTIRKYEFGLKLIQDLATRRGISRIDQIDLAFVDAFKIERETHRVKPRKKDTHAKGQAENNSQ